MSERVNVIRDGRASFREEKLAKDLSWRAGELESSRLSFQQFYTFLPKTVDPCGPTTSGPAQLAVFDIAYPASKFSIRGGIVEVMCELESRLYGRGHYHQKYDHVK